jgi:hypothetical protein
MGILPVTEPSHAVFLSYASQDAEAAQILRGADAWDQKIRHEIHDCALFIPMVSHSTLRSGSRAIFGTTGSSPSNAPITWPNRSPSWCRSSLTVPAIRRSFRRTTYLALRSEHLETLVLTGKPLVIRAGLTEMLAGFCVSARTLSVDLGRIDGGADGVLPSLVSLIRHYTVSRNLEPIEWLE